MSWERHGFKQAAGKRKKVGASLEERLFRAAYAVSIE
jgi:hypothetical protein